MFECVEDGVYADVARPLGCDIINDSRSIGVADFDGDGRMDMMVANNADPPVFLLNRQQDVGNWLRIGLTGAENSNRDAVGAKVQVTFEANGKERTLTRWVEVGLGFCTQSDLRLHYGLGDAESISSIDVTWLGGKTESFKGNDVKNVVNSDIRIKLGAGKVIRLPSTKRSEVAQVNH